MTCMIFTPITTCSPGISYPVKLAHVLIRCSTTESCDACGNGKETSFGAELRGKSVPNSSLHGNSATIQDVLTCISGRKVSLIRVERVGDGSQVSLTDQTSRQPRPGQLPSLQALLWFAPPPEYQMQQKRKHIFLSEQSPESTSVRWCLSRQKLDLLYK